MKKLASLTLTAGVALALVVGGVSTTYADDAPASAQGTEATSSASAAPEAPSTDTQAASASSGESSETAAAPVTDQPTAPVETSTSIASSPAPATTSTVASPAISPVTPPVRDTGETKDLSWLTTNTTEPTADTVNWDQTVYDPTSCGINWIQNDKLKYGTAEQRAIVDALDDDGVLKQGEDSSVIISWTFTQQTPCVVVPPVKPTVQACTAFGPTVTTATDESGALPSPWVIGDTRTAGHNVITGATLHVYTDDSSSQAKAAAYYPVSIPLGHIGTPAITYAASTGTHPGFQLVLSSGRILVGEPDYYGDRFWSKTAQDGVPANDGYAASADLNTWLAALPDETVTFIGYSLGSGVKGDHSITSLTLGTGCDLTFAPYVAPPVVVIPEKPSTEPTVTTSEDKSCDADTITSTTTTTTLVYHYDAESNTWVRDADDVQVATATREATDEECPVVIPEQPADIVVVSTTDGTPVCDDGIVPVTVTTSTTKYELAEDNTWVAWGEPVVTTRVETRDATALECPVVVTPDTPATPTAAEVTDVLAFTGVNLLLPVGSGALALIIGFGLVVARRIRAQA